jgi:uncharacterized coiled-coil protein SlyX
MSLLNEEQPTPSEVSVVIEEEKADNVESITAIGACIDDVLAELSERASSSTKMGLHNTGASASIVLAETPADMKTGQSVVDGVVEQNAVENGTEEPEQSPDENHEHSIIDAFMRMIDRHDERHNSIKTTITNIDDDIAELHGTIAKQSQSIDALVGQLAKCCPSSEEKSHVTTVQPILQQTVQQQRIGAILQDVQAAVNASLSQSRSLLLGNADTAGQIDQWYNVTRDAATGEIISLAAKTLIIDGTSVSAPSILNPSWSQLSGVTADVNIPLSSSSDNAASVAPASVNLQFTFQVVPLEQRAQLF